MQAKQRARRPVQQVIAESKRQRLGLIRHLASLANAYPGRLISTKPAGG
jgi:hypothetical protein